MRHYIAPAVLCAALAGAGCVINVDADQVVVREEKRFTAAANAELSLSTFDGSIAVQAWDRPDVLVAMEKRGPDRETAAALEVTAAQEGSRITVAAVAPRVSREFVGIGNFSSPSVSFVVSVPRGLKITAHTRDGSVKATNTAGDLTVRTDDGSVRAEDVSGRVSLETGDGSIHADGRMDVLHAQTGDGSVVIDADEGSSMRGDWDVSTGDGSIVFRVPANFSAEIDASSRDGSVRGDLAGLERTEDASGQRSVRGRLGAGGHTVTLRSGDGSIRVVSR